MVATILSYKNILSARTKHSERYGVTDSHNRCVCRHVLLTDQQKQRAVATPCPCALVLLCLSHPSLFVVRVEPDLLVAAVSPPVNFNAHPRKNALRLHPKGGVGIVAPHGCSKSSELLFLARQVLLERDCLLILWSSVYPLTVSF